VVNSNNIKQIVEAADLLHRTLRKLVVSGQGIHAETIIAAAARMSGTMLFRSFSPTFDHLPPGAVVMSDQGNEQGPVLLSTMFATLKQLGHDDIDEQRLGGATDTTAQSQLSLSETQTILEPWYRKTMEVCRLSFCDTAAAAAMATALQIHDCRSVLQVHSGCAIAIHGMVESLKTVPQPLAAAS
jgi:hypothetical protein